MKDFLKKLKLNEANIGLGLGVAVLVLAGLLLVSYFRSINRIDNGDKTLSTSTDQPATTVSPKGEEVKQVPTAGGEYTVQKGDSLWKISMKTYGTGYAWSKVYEANKETVGKNPSVLSEGTKLVLPNSEVASSDYKIVRGDNLWNISVKLCGDGMVWTKIAQDNSLANPRLIKPGVTLKVQCKN